MTWLRWFRAALTVLLARFSRPQAPQEPVQPPTTPPASLPPPSPPTPIPAPPSAPAALLWDTPKLAYHNVRVICDDEGLTYAQKNLICARIYQESRFNNEAIGRNTKSTDWGIVQVNDLYHIGPGKDFPSVAYVLDNPEKMVRWMVAMFRVGELLLWASYSSGAYRQWLVPTSPMWKLAA